MWRAYRGRMATILLALTAVLALATMLGLMALLAHAIHADRLLHRRHLRPVESHAVDRERIAA